MGTRGLRGLFLVRFRRLPISHTCPDQHAQGVAVSANYAGEVELEIREQVLRPSVGEELYNPAGMLHRATLHNVRNIGKTTSRWLYGYKTLCESL
jgi:hypothetical protein